MEFLYYQPRDVLPQSLSAADIHVVGLAPGLATLTGVLQEPATPTVSFTKKESITLSTFVLEEWLPTKNFGLSGGARIQTDGIQNKLDNRRWSTQVHAQVGAVFQSDLFGAKLVFAQGFRPADAVSMYSTVGTLGYPGLKPERSNELAS